MAYNHQNKPLSGIIEHRLADAETSGYILKCENGTEYVLAVPAPLLRLVSEALRDHCRVQIIDYRRVRLSNALHIQALEVYRIELLESLTKNSVHDDTVLDLSQVILLEKYLQQHPSKTSFTFKGKIQAVSPIIDAKKQNPFALIELVQDIDDEHYSSCIVVISSDALVMQPGLIPGDELVLINASRKKWKINSTFSLQNISDYVFTVSRREQLTCLTSCVNAKLPSTTHSINLEPELDAIIQSVHRKTMGDELYLHFLDLDHERRLYIFSLPLSTSTALLIRPGAHLRVFHLHVVQQNSVYAACMRTTLLVDKPSNKMNTSTDLTASLSFTKLSRSIPLDHTRQLLQQWRRRSQRLDRFIEHDDWLSIFEENASSMSKNLNRNAYTEFLDPIEGCIVVKAHSNCLPQLLLTVDEVRLAVKSVYPKLFRDDSYKVGWTGSLYWTAAQLFQAKSEKVYLGALCTLSVHEDDYWHGILTDSEFQVPAIAPVTLSHDHRDPHVAFVRIRGISLSCVCLGMLPNNKSHLSLHSILPYQDNEASEGSCSLIMFNKHLFLVCWYLDCEEYRPVLPSKVHRHMVPTCSHGTVQSCLEEPSDSDSFVFFHAMMTRKICSLARIRNHSFTGFLWTFCHAPVDESGNFTPSDHVSCIQSIEMKPAIDVDVSKRLLLQRVFASATGSCIGEDQLAIALAWWRLADDPTLCALLSGGWDDYIDKTGLPFSVMVRIPRSAMERDEKRGYIRFRLGAKDLVAVPKMPNAAPLIIDTESAELSLQYSSQSKMPKGTISRRPLRRTLNLDGKIRVDRGEMIFEPQNSGTPLVSLAELHRSLCHDLRYATRTRLSPSIARKISTAKFLGILFCRAIAQCSQCNNFLRSPHYRKEDQKWKKQKTENEGIEKESFWHRPLPSDRNDCSAQTKPFTTDFEIGKLNTPLICPEKCDVKQHGSITWECSGELDDGTGRAKVYAERDCALALLGMSSSIIIAIEAGAWLDEEGVIFKKMMPPKSYLRDAIIQARVFANDLNRGSRKRPTYDQVMQFLPPAARAEYLMQHHCRYSREPLRQQTYIVSCKPLSDDSDCLYQREIELAVEGNNGDADTRLVSSYILPPLSLNLLDCYGKNS